MKIIILGAGQVGGTLAAHLAREDNDVTIVDNDVDQLKTLNERLDIRTIVGCASHPNILEQAGAEDSEMLIAVTSSDESNMIACQIAYTLFRTPTKIARVRAVQYMSHKELFDNDALPVDVLISPEQLVTDYVRRLIQHPDAFQVLDFAGGKLQLVAANAYYGGPLVGQALENIKSHLPDVAAKVVAIFREGNPITTTEDTVIEPDDEVFFICARENVQKVMAELRRLDRPNKRIVIAGGGNIGTRLCESLENQFQVKIIERDPKRVEDLGLKLNNTIVLQGDAADKELLLDENILESDVFCAVTNQDEANIMSAILAKRLGARKVMALVNRPAYVDVIDGGDVDIAISPQQTTLGSLLAHVRRGDVVKVHSLRRGSAEAMEAIAHGTPESSKVVGRAIKDIDLPPGATIAAMVRGDNVIIAHDETVVEAEDHLVIFLIDKRYVHDVEQLFQVGFSFF